MCGMLTPSFVSDTRCLSRIGINAGDDRGRPSCGRLQASGGAPSRPAKSRCPAPISVSASVSTSASAAMRRIAHLGWAHAHSTAGASTPVQARVSSAPADRRVLWRRCRTLQPDPDALPGRSGAEDRRRQPRPGRAGRRLGTGIAARQFQAAGSRVLGVDPDERMAPFARRAGPHVEVAAFGDWDPTGRQFDAVVSGTAWHWVDPVAGAAKAAGVLRPAGWPRSGTCSSFRPARGTPLSRWTPGTADFRSWGSRCRTYRRVPGAGGGQGRRRNQRDRRVRRTGAMAVRLGLHPRAVAGPDGLPSAPLPGFRRTSWPRCWQPPAPPSTRSAAGSR